MGSHASQPKVHATCGPIEHGGLAPIAMAAAWAATASAWAATPALDVVGLFAGMQHMTGVTDTIYRPNMLNAQQQQCQKGKFIGADIAPAVNPALVAMSVAVTDAAMEAEAMARTRAARTGAQDAAAASEAQRAQQNKPRF